MFTTENAEILDDFWKRRTQLYCMYCKRAFFIKALKYRRFGNVRIIICWHIKHKFFGHEKRPHDSGLYHINIRLIYEKLYWAL